MSPSSVSLSSSSPTRPCSFATCSMASDRRERSSWFCVCVCVLCVCLCVLCVCVCVCVCGGGGGGGGGVGMYVYA